MSALDAAPRSSMVSRGRIHARMQPCDVTRRRLRDISIRKRVRVAAFRIPRLAALALLCGCSSAPAVTTVQLGAAAALPATARPILPSPFHLAAISREEGGPFAVFNLGAAVFVVDREAPVVARVTDGDLVWDPSLFAGLPADFLEDAGTKFPSTITALAGTWPDAAWMVSDPNPAGSWTRGWRIHRWQRDHWAREPALPPEPLGFFGWIRSFGASRFFIVHGDTRDAEVPMVLQQIHGEPLARLPRMPCITGPAAIDALPSGEAFMVAASKVPCRGVETDHAVTGGVLFVWAKETSEARAFALPKGFSANGLFAHSPTEVYLAGTATYGGTEVPMVARFDGATMRTTRLPGDGSPQSIAREPDGTLWVAGGFGSRGKPTETPSGGVWRRPPRPANLHETATLDADEWSPVPLPALPAPPNEAGPDYPSVSDVVVTSPGDVWVTGTSKIGKVVFRTRPPSRVFEVPGREARWEAIRATGRGDLPLPVCHGLRVVVLPAQLGARPETRLSAIGRLLRAGKDLRGVELGEVKLPEGLTIVATVPDVPTGDRLVRAIHKIGAGLMPKLLCREKWEIRPIALP